MLDDNTLKGNLFCLANVDAKKVLDSLEDDNNEEDFKDCRKRKRLDDFTPQEKMIRRKLKNRVAAQSARDRKKERLEHLEVIVTRLEKENKELKKSNEELRSNMNNLMTQNKKMRVKLNMDDNDDTKPQKRQSQIIITPTVMDHDHIVIKKEEDTEPEYASLGISLPQKVQILLVSLITMWLTNPSQLLDLLEQIGTRSFGEITFTEKVAVTQKAKLTESEVYTETIENESSPDNTDMSSGEADELFSLCRDIQDLVDGSDNTLKEISDINVVSLLQEIPEEVTKVSSTKKDFIDIDKFFETDEICCSNSLTSEDSDLSALLEDEVSYSSTKDSWDDDFLDLFPSLASV